MHRDELIGDIATKDCDLKYRYSLIINPSLGMYQEIHPYRIIKVIHQIDKTIKYPRSLWKGGLILGLKTSMVLNENWATDAFLYPLS